MEDWLREAKESAKIEAKCIIEDIVDTATKKDLEPNWYVEEVVKHINILKNKGIEPIQTEAKESAKIEAKLIVKDIVDTAIEKNLKPVWYAQEVIRNINDIKNEGIANASGYGGKTNDRR